MHVMDEIENQRIDSLMKVIGRASTLHAGANALPEL